MRAEGRIGVKGMQQFDPQLIQVMRGVLEDIMTSVPMEQSSQAVKAYLAECILKAAAEGHTNYDALMAAAAGQMHVILSLARGQERLRITPTPFHTDDDVQHLVDALAAVRAQLGWSLGEEAA
jgi:selenocysteine lyase/cysteine desulfurase